MVVIRKPSPHLSLPSSMKVKSALRGSALLSAGTVTAPLGGRPGMGAGALRGPIFFDADNNGRREAKEAAGANLVVVLDLRFCTTTDAKSG